MLSAALIALALNAHISGTDLEQILQTVAEGTRPQVEKVIDRLQFLGNPRAAVDPLVQMALGEIPGSPENATYVLSVIHPPGAARAFAVLLGSDDAQLRIMSCQGLAREAPTRALDAAVGARTADPLAPVRQVCAKALASWPSTRQGKALTLALSKESDPDARLAEIEALGRASGSASAAALEPLLKSPRQAERYAAARSLAERGVPAGKNALSGWLSALDAGVRADAVALVAPIPGAWAQGALAERLDDPDASVCIAAARALIARKDPRGVTALVLRAERANAADKSAFERVLVELQITQAQRLDIIERAQPKKVAPAPQ